MSAGYASESEHSAAKERRGSSGRGPEQDLPDADALMVALIMAPGTFSRNRFFGFYENERVWQARRRAQVVRSLIKELTEPWPVEGSVPSHPRAACVEQRHVSGGVCLTFSVPDLGYRRTAHLTEIEAAALRYCLHRAGKSPLFERDKALVEGCLARLAPQLAEDTRQRTDVTAESGENGSEAPGTERSTEDAEI